MLEIGPCNFYEIQNFALNKCLIPYYQQILIIENKYNCTENIYGSQYKQKV